MMLGDADEYLYVQYRKDTVRAFLLTNMSNKKKDTQNKEFTAKESGTELHYELNGTNVNVLKSYIVSPYCGCAPQRGQTDSEGQMQAGHMQYQ